MTLFLVATPIGNLEDISQRALLTLQRVELILCEDTRTSLKLIRRFEIKTALRAFHRFNEEAQRASIMERLEKGEEIALISDAGTPGICDPGERLVQEARQKQLVVTPIPGCCSLIAALVASGLKTHPFTFFGFLEKKESERKKQLEKAVQAVETHIFFESPLRLLSTLKLLEALAPERRLSLAKEITKIYETFFLGTASQAVLWLNSLPAKGEWVLLLEGASSKEAPVEVELASAIEYAKRLIRRGLTPKDAILAASELSHRKPQEFYKNFLPKGIPESLEKRDLLPFQ